MLLQMVHYYSVESFKRFFKHQSGYVGRELCLRQCGQRSQTSEEADGEGHY